MSAVSRQLFPPANQQQFNQELEQFFHRNNLNIDQLYASFQRKLDQARNEGTGAFTNPRDCAYGYMTVIEHLLNSDFENLLPDGTLIPRKRLDLAVEKYNEAVDSGVWAPRGVDRRVSDFCASYGNRALEAIQNAEKRFDAVSELNPQESSDEDDWKEIDGNIKDFANEFYSRLELSNKKV